MLAELALLAAASAVPKQTGCALPTAERRDDPAAGISNAPLKQELGSFGRKLQPEDGAKCYWFEMLSLYTIFLQYRLFGMPEEAVRIADVLVHFHRAELARSPDDKLRITELRNAEFNLLVARLPLGETEAVADGVAAELARMPSDEPGLAYRNKLNILASIASQSGAHAIARDLSNRSLAAAQVALAGRGYFPDDTEQQSKDIWACMSESLKLSETDRVRTAGELARSNNCVKYSSEFLERSNLRESHEAALHQHAESSLALGKVDEARRALAALAAAPTGYDLNGFSALLYARFLKSQGDSGWRKWAEQARKQAKVDLGIHDPELPYSGQFLPVQHVIGAQDAASSSGWGLLLAGETELLLERPGIALTYILPAIPSLEKNAGKDGVSLARAHYLRGLALIGMGRGVEAVEPLARASRAYDDFAPSSRDIRRSANNWFEGSVDVHLAYLEAGMWAKDEAAVGEALMRSGRSRLSRSVTASLDRAAQLDGSQLVRRAQDSARAATAADQALQQAISSGAPQNRLDSDAESARRARLQAGDALNQALAANPKLRLFGLGMIASPTDVGSLLPAQSAIMIFSVGRDRAFVGLITNHGWWVRKIEATRPILTRLVNSVHKSSSFQRTAAGMRLSPFDLAGASELYRLLIRPFEDELAGVDRLYVARNTPFDGLSFASLWDDRKRQWLNDKMASSVVLDPSIMTAGTRMASAATGTVLGVGDPVVTASAFRDLTIDDARPISPRPHQRPKLGQPANPLTPKALPGAVDELRMIATSYGQTGSLLLTGANATEANFRHQAPQYRIIALATHAVTRSPAYSIAKPAVVFTSVRAGGPSNDGFLHADEVEALKLDADLVILSACETAGGDGVPGSEALSGLAQAFMFAGARAVVATHWKVESESAGLLMSKSAQTAVTIPDFARRLQAAISRVKSLPGRSHPAYWAPFVVVERAIR